jgi:hypothetical protein
MRWIGVSNRMTFMSRCVAAFVAASLAGFAALGPAPVRADSGPVIVIPSRPGVPVIINGRDASYAVVEGDWGLSRPGAVAVTVIGGSPIYPNPVYSRRNSYHPRYGHTPLRGRNEIEPPADRALPEPAEDFSRSWSTSPDPTPVNDRPRSLSGHEPQFDSDDAGAAPATITDPETFPHDVNPAGMIDRRHRQWQRRRP